MFQKVLLCSGITRLCFGKNRFARKRAKRDAALRVVPERVCFAPEKPGENPPVPGRACFGKSCFAPGKVWSCCGQYMVCRYKAGFVPCNASCPAPGKSTRYVRSSPFVCPAALTLHRALSAQRRRVIGRRSLRALLFCGSGFSRFPPLSAVKLNFSRNVLTVHPEKAIIYII